jgi:hypothetical protein
MLRTCRFQDGWSFPWLPVGGELDHEQILVVAVPVFFDHRPMRDTPAFHPGYHRIETGIEIVDPSCLEFDNLREHGDLTASLREQY